jgi:hypothetical protein
MDDAWNTAFVRSWTSVRLNITIEDDLYDRLKRELPPRRISAFISQAVRARLRPSVKTLDAAYKAARRESFRGRLAREWSRTESEAWPD